MDISAPAKGSWAIVYHEDKSYTVLVQALLLPFASFLKSLGYALDIYVVRTVM